MIVNNSLEETIDAYGDDHVGSSATTPLRANALSSATQKR